MLDHFHVISFILLSFYFWQRSETHYILYICEGYIFSPLFCAYVFMSFSSLSIPFQLSWVKSYSFFLMFSCFSKNCGSCLSYVFTVPDIFAAAAFLTFYGPQSFYHKRWIGSGPEPGLPGHRARPLPLEQDAPNNQIFCPFPLTPENVFFEFMGKFLSEGVLVQIFKILPYL